MINVLVNREMRPQIKSLAQRHPCLRIVIDHCLNLKAGASLEPTLRDMVALKVTLARHLRISPHKLGLDNATQRAVLGETARSLWFGSHPDT